MRHLDLFSGIGGFALAAQWAGIETVAFCEIEEFPRKVLAKNFPGVPIHHDIRDLDGGEYAGIDLITGGYPCQPFSVAGNRRGSRDPRHLWPEMLRVIKQARPAWVVAENVKGHVTLGLDTVLDDLESEGYTAGATLLPACAIGAVHQRERVFVLANASSPGHDTGAVCRCTSPSNDLRRTEGEKENRQHERRGSIREILDRGGCEIGTWGAKPPAIRVDDGLPNRVDRIRALGNAIVPQVAYQILRAISAA